MQRVVVGSFSPSVLLTVAHERGLLAAHDLEVAEVPVSSSPGQFGSLVAGELDLALTSPDNVIAYRYDPTNPLGRTLDVRIVGAVDRGLGLGLYAAPGVTAADLRHARVGVDVPVSGFALALYALLEDLGTVRADVDVVTLGSTPRRLEALLDGRCEVTMLNAGNELLAEQQGCTLLASVADRLAPYLGTVVAVAGDSRLDAGRRLAAALLDAAGLVLDGDHDDLVAGTAAERLGLDEAAAQRYVERLRDPREGLVPDGRADVDSLRTLVRLRTTYLPAAPGVARALDPASGLVVG